LMIALALLAGRYSALRRGRMIGVMCRSDVHGVERQATDQFSVAGQR
jgi:hypothetical protein